MEAETTFGETVESSLRFDELETLVPFDHTRKLEFLTHLHWSFSQADKREHSYSLVSVLVCSESSHFTKLLELRRAVDSEIMFLPGDPGDKFCFAQTCLYAPESFDTSFL